MSQAKPALKTHYKSKAITTLRKSSVCGPNGLRYEYYYSSGDEYPGIFTFEADIPRACMYKLSCLALQKFLFRPASAPDGVSPNVVIASQDACPANLTLEEYKEMGSLPLGRHIQWVNIMVQLAMPSVDFRKPETTLLLLQCAYQAGPRTSNSLSLSSGLGKSSILRDAHNFFNREGNAMSLLLVLNEALQRVRRNWESSQARATKSCGKKPAKMGALCSLHSTPKSFRKMKPSRLTVDSGRNWCQTHLFPRL